jgi:hypothetical protein
MGVKELKVKHENAFGEFCVFLKNSSSQSQEQH